LTPGRAAHGPEPVEAAPRLPLGEMKGYAAALRDVLDVAPLGVLPVCRKLDVPKGTQPGVHVATACSSRRTMPASTSTNSAAAFGISIRRSRSPSSAAFPVAS